MKTNKSFASTLFDNVVSVLTSPFTHEEETPKKESTTKKPRAAAKANILRGVNMRDGTP